MLNKKSFIQRTIIGIGIFAVMIGMILLNIFLINPFSNQNNIFLSGRAINSLILSVLIVLAVIEMRRAIGKERIPDYYSWIIWAYGIGLGPSYALFGFSGIVFFTLLIFASSVITALLHNNVQSLFFVAFMLVYPGLMMASLLYINRCASTQTIDPTNPIYPYLENDIWSLISQHRVTQLLPYNAIGLAFVFAVSSFTDVFAYLVGSLFGKNKLCPQISPNKSVEGAIGGVVGGLLGSTIVYLVFELLLPAVGMPQFGLSSFNLSPFNRILAYVLIGLFGSVLTQIGDLLASLVKRYCGIKDYSHILGAHGGILDRFDGILLNSVFVATVFMFII